MVMQMFVNPLPQLKVSHLLLFDFPADYHAKDTLENINIEPLGIEQIFGKLGTPPKEQGHPLIKEVRPELEDPTVSPYQDQTLDIDRKILINHTGRLSGSFVRYIAHDECASIVKLYATPVAPETGSPLQLHQHQQPLTPQTEAPNVWYWRNAAARNELLYTVKAEFYPKEKGLKPEQVYKLICKWEFWDQSRTHAERMPISGFDEAVTFEVIETTQNP